MMKIMISKNMHISLLEHACVHLHKNVSAELNLFVLQKRIKKSNFDNVKEKKILRSNTKVVDFCHFFSRKNVLYKTMKKQLQQKWNFQKMMLHKHQLRVGMNDFFCQRRRRNHAMWIWTRAMVILSSKIWGDVPLPKILIFVDSRTPWPWILTSSHPPT